MSRKNVIIIISLLTVGLFINNCVKTDAKNPVVKSTYLEEGNNGSYIVPIEIEGNTGIMGFKLNISYGDGVIINSVSRGTVTNTGTFVDNHTEASDSSFDVVWNDSKEHNEDGELLFIGFSVEDNSSGDYTFNISYSPPDTFNEQWEDIQLDCKAVTVNIDNGKSDINNQNDVSGTDYINNQDNMTDTVKNELDSTEIVNIVDNTIKEYGYKTIYDIPDEKISEYMNYVISQISNKKAADILRGFDTVKQYEIVLESYESNIETGVDESLDSVVSDTANPLLGYKNNNAYWIAGVVYIIAVSIGIIAVSILFFKRKDKRDEKV